MIDLHPDERIVLVKRRHWLPIAGEGFSFLLAAILPWVAVLIGFKISFPAFAVLRDNLMLGLFLASGWGLLMWISFFISWTNYYLDVIAVTNQRIIDIEQIGLFARDVAELRIENIEDMKVEIIGIIPSLLNFGNVHIQSAGEAKEIFLKHIPDPHELTDAISREQGARLSD